LGSYENLQPADKASDLLAAYACHSQASVPPEKQKIVHYIRPFLLGDEVAGRIFGQAGLHC